MVGAPECLLSVEEMRCLEAAAITGGGSGESLMAAAGLAIFEAIVARWQPRKTVVLCGPGNNGGDGFVVARLLADAGWPVEVALLGDRAALKGEAAGAAEGWRGETGALAPQAIAGAEIVVDALFGAGLSRPLDGAALATIEALRDTSAKGIVVVAVDVPSGLDGDTGQIEGAAAPAALTVTFCRRKTGHLLLPGRSLCGEMVVADIGIPEAALAETAPRCHLNAPEFWLAGYPRPRPDGNKYHRGHLVVVGGGAMTGAGRLAALGAYRIGAGLVTLACPPEAEATYATSLAALMTARLERADDFAVLLGDARKNAVLVGPGNGVGEVVREHALAALAADKDCILDADALSAFEYDAETLISATHASTGACVLTPHDGEYARLFRATGDRLSRARAGAAASGAVLLLKGPDTVVAHPDGRAVVAENAPPELATAGAGDVLAGMVAGLLAQGMMAFDAAAAAVWIHGEAARRFGPGLIADDLPGAIPGVLREFWPRIGQSSKPETGER